MLVGGMLATQAPVREKKLGVASGFGCELPQSQRTRIVKKGAAAR
jgi:hypothetical protein